MFQQFTFNHVLFLLKASLTTLELVALAVSFGLVGSIFMTTVLMSRITALRYVGNAFVFIIQGTPIVIVLFLVYYALPMLGIKVEPLIAMGIAFTVFTSAFLGEVWKGSIQSIGRGQWEGALALGLSRWQALYSVVLPQALKVAIPPSIGFLVQLVKGTSVVSIIGIAELTRAAQIVSNATFKPLPVFLTAAAIYFAINFPLTMASRLLERRLSLAPKG